MPAHGRIVPSWRTMGLIALLTILLAAGWVPSASAQTPADQFVDDDNSIHEGAIDAIAAIGLTNGCNPPTNDRYCPDRHLSRGEMATMLTRVGDLPSVAAARFVDTLSSVHRADIESLAAAGITNGCNPPLDDRFCPDDELTRGQMAAFLVRTLELEGGGPSFDDTQGNMFGPEIAILAAEGITKGCNPPDNNKFCPDRPVTRAEVATFLARALDLDVIDNPGNDTPGDPPPGGPPPPAPPGTPPGGDNPDAKYPGQPVPGTVLWGAAVGQNADPTERHEEPTGENLSIRRTFYQWSHRSGYMIDIAADDVAHARLPWVSIKTPGWADMASGSLDGQIDEMLNALDALSGPVWLTVHHEPEGGGGINAPDDPAGPSGHLEMNRRVRQRMDALGVDNIALAPILMDWTWDPASGRDPDDWWDPEVYDFVGVDHYVCYSGASSCEHESLLNEAWADVRAWAAAEGVDVAVGEWGMRGTDSDAAERLLGWYEAAIGSHADGQGARVVGMSAFDSAANVPESFMLSGAQLDTFHDLMGDARTADPEP